MRGTLRKHTPGKWRLQVFIGTDPTGKEIRQSKVVTAPHTRDGKKAAEIALAEWVIEVTAPDRVLDVSFGLLIARWKVHISTARLSPTTVDGYLRIAKVLDAEFGAHPIGAITTGTVDAYYTRCLGAGWSPNKVKKVHRVFSVVFNQGIRWGLASYNPVTISTPPKVDVPEVVPMPDADLVAAIKAATATGGDWPLFLRAAIGTGARTGELCAIRPSDVTGNRLTIARAVVWNKQTRSLFVKPTKARNFRTFSIDPGLAALLAAPLTRYVWGDEPKNPQSVTTYWGRLQKAGTVTESFKAIRHRSVTLLLGGGMDAGTVARRHGHTQQTMWGTYAHFMPSKDEAAPDILTGGLYD
mgnify:CR=1 FL=1